MKVSAILVAALAQVGSAHYFFDSVVTGNNAGPSFQYIRQFTRKTAYNPIKFSSNPAADIRDNSFIDGPDARCNQGAFTNAGKTQILEVAAGNSVTVKLGVGATMQHPGPSLFYMSKAPTGSVKAYDGSGDWFKIGQTGICNQSLDFKSTAWCSWDKNTVTATVPKNTPSGEYLLRVEHIGIHRSHVNQPEHFVSCVQVKVTNGGNGTPGPMVKFPGAYKNTDPYANFSIYNGFKAFPMPGPAVWDGAAGSS
ncbi:glycoside hydrolase, partial [Microdochium bolleyi]